MLLVAFLSPWEVEFAPGACFSFCSCPSLTVMTIIITIVKEDLCNSPSPMMIYETCFHTLGVVQPPLKSQQNSDSERPLCKSTAVFKLSFRHQMKDLCLLLVLVELNFHLCNFYFYFQNQDPYLFV